MKTISVIGVCAFLASYSTIAWSAGFRVGFAKVPITPSEELLPLNIGGYLGVKATAIHDQIYARSLVLEGTEENGDPITIALTYLDLVGISNRVIAKIVKGVHHATGIPSDHQFAGATHTHSAPDLQGPWGGVPDQYKEYVISQTVEAVRRAHANLQSANMFVSTTVGSGVNKNRRGWKKPTGEHFTDTEITLVEFKKPDGKPIGSLVNFAAHPILLGKVKFISRDFVGYLVDHLEAELDQTSDDIAIFANGVVGDVLPKGTKDPQVYGERIAQEAIDSRANQILINSSQISMKRIPWDLKVTGLLFKLAYLFGRLDYDAQWEFFLKLKIPTTLGVLRFGDQLQAVTFPGESLTRNGFQNNKAGKRAIKELMTTDHKLFLGLTGDSLGYFVPSDEWWSLRNNFYEQLLSPGRKAGDKAQDMLVGAMCPACMPVRTRGVTQDQPWSTSLEIE